MPIEHQPAEITDRIHGSCGLINYGIQKINYYSNSKRDFLTHSFSSSILSAGMKLAVKFKFSFKRIRRWDNAWYQYLILSSSSATQTVWPVRVEFDIGPVFFRFHKLKRKTRLWRIAAPERRSTHEFACCCRACGDPGDIPAAHMYCGGWDNRHQSFFFVHDDSALWENDAHVPDASRLKDL